MDALATSFCSMRAISALSPYPFHRSVRRAPSSAARETSGRAPSEIGVR